MNAKKTFEYQKGLFEVYLTSLILKKEVMQCVWFKECPSKYINLKRTKKETIEVVCSKGMGKYSCELSVLKARDLKKHIYLTKAGNLYERILSWVVEQRSFEKNWGW